MRWWTWSPWSQVLIGACEDSQAALRGTWADTYSDIGGATGRTLLIVDDPDAVHARALAAGATVASEVADEHGWRLGRITDPFGHEWELGTPLKPWPPS